MSVEPLCRMCCRPATGENPLKDYRHDQNCLIYEPSGACTCGCPGYLAHAFRCPITVEGDMAPLPTREHHDA